MGELLTATMSHRNGYNRHDVTLLRLLTMRRWCPCAGWGWSEREQHGRPARPSAWADVAWADVAWADAGWADAGWVLADQALPVVGLADDGDHFLRVVDHPEQGELGRADVRPGEHGLRQP